MPPEPVVDESTPLLPSLDDEDQFPPILEAIKVLPTNPSPEDLHNCYVRSLDESRPLQAAIFRLVIALYLVTTPRKEVKKRLWDASEVLLLRKQEEQERGHLQNVIVVLLDELPTLDLNVVNSNQAPKSHWVLEAEFYTFFRLKPVGKQGVNVISLLTHPNLPPAVLRHDLISLSLLRLWKFGTLSSPRRLLEACDAIASPRSLHAIHLVFQVLFLALLGHLVLYPSPPPILVDSPGGHLGIREPLIMIYSICNIIFLRFSFTSFVHILTLLPFLFSLPWSPSPNDVSYTYLLVVLYIFVLSLPFSHTPSSLLLLDPVRWLPLRFLYFSSVRRCILPAFIVLFPVLVGSAVLVSSSLAEEIPPFISAMLKTSETPYIARMVFIGLFWSASFLFFYFSLTTLLLSPTSAPLSMNDSQVEWDRYGPFYGYEGRRSLLKALAVYPPTGSDTIVFPPPFNLISMVIPQKISHVRMFLWRMVVVPSTLLVGLFWGWSNLPV